MTLSLNDLLLTPEQLTAYFAADIFSPKDQEAQQPQVFLGHHRAKDALEFGLSMEAPGFNVFAMGEHGTGR